MTVPTREEDGEPSRCERLLKSLQLPPISDTWEVPGASYISLFRQLQDAQSRLILAAGIVFAIAAGVPLPIIGVIFSRIINAFPPSEDEIQRRIGELLGVG
jgi:ATP-binding cassette subfamily B (MDR/TAP) protein 1